jgi:GNAT superfamily N-acetyltransferase
MDITYSSNRKISAKAYIELLCITSLKDRRPLNDIPRIEEMLKNTNLLLTAWDGNLLVGLARSVTDYAYCCYVSDLCVMETYQRHGIGKKLLMLTKDQLHNGAKIILLAAPSAKEYYPHLGFERHECAYTLDSAVVI